HSAVCSAEWGKLRGNATGPCCKIGAASRTACCLPTRESLALAAAAGRMSRGLGTGCTGKASLAAGRLSPAVFE
ncbi:hypothetical protein XELAEV_18032272mg, partial [Xenopus laevis]